MGEFDHTGDEERMQKAVKVFGQDLTGLRSGRASVGLLDSISVDVYGTNMPLAQVASLSVPDARTIGISVWDKANVTAVERAIAASGLDLTPQTEGQSIRLPIPPLSGERREQLAKLAGKYAEQARVSIRNIRRDAIDRIKKLEKQSQISKDEAHGYTEQMQKLTDRYIAEVDEALQNKEKDISAS